MDMDTDSYFGCFKGVSKSVQVLLNGIGAVMALSLIVLKQRAPYAQGARKTLQSTVS